MAQDLRLKALRRFGLAITILNIAGHTFLGFEQSWAQVAVALMTAYSMELALEIVDAKTRGRPVGFGGGWRALVDFLLPSHITGLAVSMLLYANDQLWPIIFATVTAIGSKAIFRTRAGQGTRHFFNPSNTGIAITLLLFPWVGIAPPYQFTENLTGAGDWLLPVILICTGSFLNARLTKRIPLIVAWVGGFALQAVLRNQLFETSIISGLLPITGVAFLLFTFYMITDPGTTPSHPRRQVIFGLAVAGAYAALMTFHVVFGFFFALLSVCAMRGIGLYVLSLYRSAEAIAVSSPALDANTVILRKVEL